MKRKCGLVFLIFVLLFTACGKSTAEKWQEQYDLGMQYLTDGDYEAAIVAFTEAIEIEPKRAALYIARGDVYVAWAEETETIALAAVADGKFLAWEDISVEDNSYTLQELYENAQSDYEDAVELLENGEAEDQSDDLLENVRQKLEESKTKQEDGRNEFARELIELAEQLLESDRSEEEKELADQCLETALGLTNDEELVKRVEDIYTETEEENASNIFQEKIKELVNTYGVFDEEQSGTMYTVSDEWFDPMGILGVSIFDFDADGTLEMMICIAEEHVDSDYMIYNEYYDYDIFMYMYEIENGAAVISDKIYFGAYMESEYSQATQVGLGFRTNLWDEQFFAINILEINGRIYIVCEAKMVGTAFGDGQWKSYWIIQYNDSAFQYVSSLTSPGIGSANFKFYAYHFENGVLAGSDLYYSDLLEEYDVPGLYDSFVQALREFFNDYDIEITDSAATFQSTLAASNNILEVLSFTNLFAEYDFSGYTYPAEFSANLIRGNDLLNGF